MVLSIIDFQQLRITGRDSYIPSLNVRMNILQELFIKHLSHAPVFGDMFVHFLVFKRQSFQYFFICVIFKFVLVFVI